MNTRTWERAFEKLFLSRPPGRLWNVPGWDQMTDAERARIAEELKKLP